MNPLEADGKEMWVAAITQQATGYMLLTVNNFTERECIPRMATRINFWSIKLESWSVLDMYIFMYDLSYTILDLHYSKYIIT